MVKKIFSKIFFLSILFMIFPSQSANLSSRIQIPVTKYQLKNGMKVLLNPNSKSSVCSYVWGIPIGSRHERKGLTGISHMFEHLLFKGTEKYSIYEVYAKHGVTANAATSHDNTFYEARFPCNKLGLVLDVESDRMVNLTITQEDLGKERQVVQEERYLRVDNSPKGKQFIVFMDTLFIKHPYRWPVIGYARDIAGYTLEDLRDWYKTYYSPNNITLTLSGNFSKSKAKKLIEKYFGKLKPTEIPKEILVKEPEQNKPRYVSIKKDIKSPIVIMGFKIGPSGTKEFLAFKSLSYILGVGESSRLYKKLVREEKLVSSIGAGVMELLQESVFLIYYPLLDSVNEKKVRSIIQQEIQKIIKEPISDRELGKVKNIQLTELVSKLKTSLSRSYTLYRYEILYQNYKKIYTDIDDLDSLSSQYIQEVSKKYLNPKKISYVILKSTRKGK